jgi:hypothetical protein
MTSGPETVATPSASELEAISSLWRREGRTLVTTFTGVSMMPNIAPGESVSVECGLAPEIGDVVMFLRDNQVGVHRVVARCGGALITWGDANPLPDFPVEFARIVGTIRQVAPRPASLYRAVVLIWLSTDDLAKMRRRLQFAYRLQGALTAGPIVFARKAWRALHRTLPS